MINCCVNLHILVIIPSINSSTNISQPCARIDCNFNRMNIVSQSDKHDCKIYQLVGVASLRLKSTVFMFEVSYWYIW